MIKNKNVHEVKIARKVQNEIKEADELDEIGSPTKSDKISNHSSPAVINTQGDYLDQAVDGIQNDDLRYNNMADQLISIQVATNAQ